MSKKPKIINEVKERSFADILREELSRNNTIEEGIVQDGSASWIVVKSGNYNLNFDFHGVFEYLSHVWVTEDIVKIIDEKVIVKF